MKELGHYPMQINDLPMFLEIRNECRDSLHDNRYFTLMEILEWWKKNWGSYTYASLGEKQYWKLYLLHGGIMPSLGVPMIGYARIQEDHHNKVVTVGVDLHKDYRGKGFGQEAYQLLFDHYFRRDAYHRIELEVLATNAPALTLYKKIGFREEGMRREAVYRASEDKYVDSILMSILADEWRKNNENL